MGWIKPKNHLMLLSLSEEYFLLVDWQLGVGDGDEFHPELRRPVHGDCGEPTQQNPHCLHHPGNCSNIVSPLNFVSY